MAAIVYRAMATTGSSRATEAGRASALKHADIFCYGFILDYGRWEC